MDKKEVAKGRRDDFVRTVGSGKAISAAREKGYELISEDRLGDLLADLNDARLLYDGMGQDEILEAAKRGMGILRG